MGVPVTVPTVTVLVAPLAHTTVALAEGVPVKVTEKLAVPFPAAGAVVGAATV